MQGAILGMLERTGMCKTAPQQIKTHPGNMKSMETIATISTPTNLSEPPSRMEFHLPTYDWKTQTRLQTVVGAITSCTKQTFDSNGRPKDQTSDQD